MKFLPYFSAITLLWISSQPELVHAQADNKPFKTSSIYDLSLEDLLAINVSMETAGKRMQRVEDIAASVFVISAQDIREGGFKTINEALSLVPGMHVSKTWRYDPLTVRGVSNATDQVLFLIDGQAMTNKGDNTVIFNQAAPIGIHSVERIEVILGPGSALYGSGAFTAIVNTFTKSAKEGLKPELYISSAGPKNIALSFGHHFPESKLSIFASAHDSPGEKLDFNFPNSRPPEYLETSGTADGFNTVEDNKLSTKFLHNNWAFSMQYSDSKLAWPTSSFYTDFNNQENFLKFTSTSFQVKHPYSFSQDLDSALRVYYNDNETVWHGVYDDAAFLTPAGNPDWSYGGSYYGTEYQLLYALSKKFDLTSGVEFTDNNKLFSVDSETSFTQASLYSTIDYRLSEKLALNLGARIEKFSFRSESEFIPKSALVYKPIQGSTLKFLYGRAFLAPSAWELQVAELVDNNNLKPEIFDSLEFIYQQRFDTSSASISIFGSEITDAREILDTGDPNTSYIFNIPSPQRFSGFDLSSTFLLATQSSLKLGLSYVNTEQTNLLTDVKESVTGASDWMSYFSVRIPLSKGVLTTHAKYISSPDSHPDINAWTKVDLSYFSKNIIGFEVQAKIENVFDEHLTAFPTADLEGVVREVPHSARNITLSIAKQL